MKIKLLVFPTGNSARMVCAAGGYPPPTVAWYKNGKRFTKIDKDDPHPISPHDFTIQIRALIPDDSGVYTCNVSNKLGYINKSYTLEVQGKYKVKKTSWKSRTTKWRRKS